MAQKRFEDEWGTGAREGYEDRGTFRPPRAPQKQPGSPLLRIMGAIAIVVAEAWFGVVCPLTSLEMWLRAKAHETTYTGSFVEHWLQRILYYEAPPWIFTVAYSIFGLLVAASWWYFPPKYSCRPIAPPRRT